MNRYLVLLALTIFTFPSSGQDKMSNTQKVEVIARALPDQIKIRWAPSTPDAWMLANKYGYLIERVTVVRDNKVLTTPQVTKINTEPIMPLPLAQWEPIVKKNKYGAIAAQAIFGKTFELKNNTTNVIDIANKTRENESRFSFALFAAAQSFEVANASGLVLVDKRVNKNEK